MDDVVLIACGGAARSMIRDHPTDRLPVFAFDPDADDDVRVFRDTSLIGSVLGGARAALVFAFLGGGTATGHLMDVIDSIKGAGCRPVAVLGIPPSFDIRRSTAMNQLDVLHGTVDRMILLDVQSSLDMSDPDVGFDAVFRILSHTTAFALDCVLQLFDGPFFTTFSQPEYTFSYVNTMIISDAVGAAIRTVAFPITPAIGKLIVAVGSGCTGAEMNQVRATAAFRTGILPDVFKRDDPDTNRVVVFVPIAPSPTVSRS